MARSYFKKNDNERKFDVKISIIKDNEEVMTCDTIGEAFSDIGLYEYTDNEKMGFLNEEGKVYLKEIFDPLKYDAAGAIADSDVRKISTTNSAITKLSIGGKYLLIDLNDKGFKSRMYDRINPFYQDRAICEVYGKAGMINSEGVELVPAIYDRAESYYVRDIVPFVKGDEVHFISRNAEEVLVLSDVNDIERDSNNDELYHIYGPSDIKNIQFAKVDDYIGILINAEYDDGEYVSGGELSYTHVNTADDKKYSSDPTNNDKVLKIIKNRKRDNGDL